MGNRGRGRLPRRFCVATARDACRANRRPSERNVATSTLDAVAGNQNHAELSADGDAFRKECHHLLWSRICGDVVVGGVSVPKEKIRGGAAPGASKPEKPLRMSASQIVWRVRARAQADYALRVEDYGEVLVRRCARYWQRGRGR